MSRHGSKSKTHILIPAGTVNPNESAILEVSLDGAQKNTLVAKRNPNQGPNRTRLGNTSMNYTDFESGLRNETTRTQAGFMSSTMPRNEPPRHGVSFMNSTMQNARDEPTRTEFMPSAQQSYIHPPTNFNVTSPPDPLEQTELEERQALLSQLQEYQRARRQYLVSATPTAATNATFNPTVPPTARTIACQACCTYRTLATQTQDTYPCRQVRSGPNMKTAGITLNFPPFPNQDWNAAGCSGAPSVSNSCKIRPCYSGSDKGSDEYCQLCEKVYGVLNEGSSKETVELWRNCSGPSVPSAPTNRCPCIMSQRELEKVARRFEEIRAKLGICKSLISNKVSQNDEIERISPSRSCYEPVGHKVRSYERIFDTGKTKDDDVFEQMLQESERLFKQQKELLQQTRQQLMNECNSYQELKSCSVYSLPDSPAASKSILKNCNFRIEPSIETKRCVTVSPEVRTFSMDGKTSWGEMRTCPSDTGRCAAGPRQSCNRNDLQANDISRNVQTETISFPTGTRCLPPEIPRPSPGASGSQPCNKPQCPHGKKMREARFDSEKQFAYDLGKASSKIGTRGYDHLCPGRTGLVRDETPAKADLCSAVRTERTGVPFDGNDVGNEAHTL